jgi:hypothetical protein
VNITKHTRGPWAAIQHKTLSGDPGGPLKVETHLTVIAEILYREEVEQKANAALIAAAPELLDAIKRLLNCRELDDLNVIKRETFDAIHQAHLAIEKAVGL